MASYSNTRKITIFATGLALSAALACLVTAYTFTKNTSLDFLLYLFLALIVMILIGLTVTYFAYKRLLDILEQLQILASPFLVFLLHTVNLLAFSKILLAALISFEIAYGYFLLPIAIDITGAIILICMVSVLRSTVLSPMLRALLLIIATALITILAVVLV